MFALQLMLTLFTSPTFWTIIALLCVMVVSMNLSRFSWYSSKTTIEEKVS